MTTRLNAPRDFTALTAGDEFTLSAGTTVGRIFFRGGSHPANWNSFRTFGPVSRMRFDHHPLPPGDHPGHAIAYVAPSRGRTGPLDPLAAGIMECFGETGTIDTRAGDPWFALWAFTADLELLDVVDGPWITRMHGNAAISSGPRAVCRAWARKAHRTYSGIHGIFYQTSSVPMMRSMALFERAMPLLPKKFKVCVPLSHPGLQPALRRIADTFGVDLLP
jgi:hypothetical protein